MSLTPSVSPGEETHVAGGEETQICATSMRPTRLHVVGRVQRTQSVWATRIIMLGQLASLRAQLATALRAASAPLQWFQAARLPQHRLQRHILDH